MAERILLPFPRLCTRPTECLRCGYPLEGIPAPGRCPECGLGFDDDYSVLQIAGVAKSDGGPAWRKIVWGVLFGVTFVYAQLIVLVVTRYPWASLISFAALSASIVAMAITSKQKNRGSEHFAFTESGFSRWTIGTDPDTRVYADWVGGQRMVVLKKVSPVWARLKVVAVGLEGKRSVVLDAGLRCPHEDLDLLERILGRLVGGEPIGMIEGMEGSIFLRDGSTHLS